MTIKNILIIIFIIIGMYISFRVLEIIILKEL
jgi:ABC-type uncharacterized transport system permease subunit